MPDRRALANRALPGPALVVLALVTSLVLTGPPSSASARAVAETSGRGDRGPALTVDADRLRAAVHCPSRERMRKARRTVLLVAGTGSTPSESWGWSYRPALAADGFATCTVRLPQRALGSFTRAAEYVVHAARHAARRSGKRIALVGHSQGGALAVWVTKFWPDVARRVTDVVSIAGPFHGTALADELCTPGRCAALAWQLRTGAHTVRALARAPLPRRVSVTSIATAYDEIVRPQPRASHLRGARNVVAQDVCAADPVEHGTILGDPVTYAVALDALTHRGPARPSRLPASLCTQTFIPHGDAAGSAEFLSAFAHFTLGVVDPRLWVTREPRLPRYARPWGR
jgi:hypothetical protein